MVTNTDETPQKKLCNICGVALTEENTYPRKGGGLPARCIKCYNKKRKEARLRDPVKYQSQQGKQWFFHGKEYTERSRERYAIDKKYRDMHRNASNNYHKKNREKILSKQNRIRREIWYEALDFFGGGCACCGESTVEFLSVDHIHGGGCILRRDRGERVGNELLRSFKANGWNEAIKKHYRLLCYNCNQSLGRFGYCPHEFRQYTRYNLPGEGFYYLIVFNKKEQL